MTLSAKEVSTYQHVYVVTGGLRYCKIGVAHDVYKRIAGIQTGCPFRVKLVRCWLTPYAFKIETAAHKKLANFNSVGEWFDVPASAAVATVAALMKQNPRNPAVRDDRTTTIVVCMGCRRSAAVQFVPEGRSRFRCSKCNGFSKVHVVTV
jgi:hypothetical protein